MLFRSLQPWADLEPDAEFPDLGPIVDLLASLGDQGISRRDDLALTLE